MTCTLNDPALANSWSTLCIKNDVWLYSVIDHPLKHLSKFDMCWSCVLLSGCGQSFFSSCCSMLPASNFFVDGLGCTNRFDTKVKCVFNMKASFALALRVLAPLDIRLHYSFLKGEEFSFRKQIGVTNSNMNVHWISFDIQQHFALKTANGKVSKQNEFAHIFHVKWKSLELYFANTTVWTNDSLQIKEQLLLSKISLQWR